MTGPNFKIGQSLELESTSFGVARPELELARKCEIAGICSQLRSLDQKQEGNEKAKDLDRNLEHLDLNFRKLTQTTYFHLQRLGEDVPTEFRRIKDFDKAPQSQVQCLRHGLRCLPGFEHLDDHQADQYLRKLPSSEGELLRLSALLSSSELVRSDWAQQISRNLDETVTALDQVVNVGKEYFEAECESVVKKLDKDSSGVFSRALEFAEEVLHDVFDFNDHEAKLTDQERKRSDQKDAAAEREERRRRKARVTKSSPSSGTDADDSELGVAEVVLVESSRVEAEEALEALELEQLWQEVAQAIAEDLEESATEELEDLSELREEILDGEEAEEAEIRKLFAECPQIANLSIAVGLTQELWTENKSQAFLEMVKSWYLSRRSMNWQEIEAA